VFNQDCKQEDIYHGAQIPTMVKNCIDGFHSTIFCYGQTGAGKTYTMDGYKYRRTEKGHFIPHVDEENQELNNGLVQRCFK
jgi:kinesin family member 5